MTRLLLLRPHTHAGKAHSPGDRLVLSPCTADWLIAHGIAMRDDAATAPMLARRPMDDEEADALPASTTATKPTHRIKEPKA